MIIYHGSKKEIAKPIQGGSDAHNDYGPSFYMTIDLDAAKSWACKNNTIGVVNKYKIDKSKYNKLKILDLTNKESYGVLNWIAILMHFRELDSSFVRNNQIALKWLEKYYIDVNDYDVVIGYRADDSYFRFPSRFVSNDLSFDDLEDIYMKGNLGIQHAFMSKKAIDLLKFDTVIECDESFIGRHYSLIKSTTKEFDELLSRPRDPRKTYIIDLIRKDNEQ